jgi:Raf kinase inhibitor-like YbhB/YbcL family protein
MKSGMFNRVHVSGKKWFGQGGRVLCLFLALSGCQAPSPPSKEEGIMATIPLTSSAFREGESIPQKYTADGPDLSPPLQWGEPPAGTRSWALICEDPDAPRGLWVHWVLFNLPADTRRLDEGVPPQGTLSTGARQGKNDFGKLGYGGPAPPPGKPHRYYFKLYALDTLLDLPAGATRAQLLQAMKGHILAEGQLMGRYGR